MILLYVGGVIALGFGACLLAGWWLLGGGL